MLKYARAKNALAKHIEINRNKLLLNKFYKKILYFLYFNLFHEAKPNIFLFISISINVFFKSTTYDILHTTYSNN